METFALHLPRWWIIRVCGRNPLIRLTDRIEAAMLVLAVAVSITALPVAAAVATAVHAAHAAAYAEQARTRHPVTAIAVHDSTDIVRPFAVTSTVTARWHTPRGDHTGPLESDSAVKAGDRIDIWVNDAGDPVTAPPPVSQAGIEAVSAAVTLWVCATACAAALFTLVRVLLGRCRSAAWEKAIVHLANGDGGRTNSQP